MSLVPRTLPEQFRLSYGRSPSFKDGACLMEAVAYVAGEPHSDNPQCACPVLSTMGRKINDWLLDDDRQRLVHLIHRLVGTRAGTPEDGEIARARAFVMIDSVIRDLIPMGFDVIGEARGNPPVSDRLHQVAWAQHADSLRSLGSVSCRETAIVASTRAGFVERAMDGVPLAAVAFAAESADMAAHKPGRSPHEFASAAALIVDAIIDLDTWLLDPQVLRPPTIAAYTRAIEVS